MSIVVISLFREFKARLIDGVHAAVMSPTRYQSSSPLMRSRPLRDSSFLKKEQTISSTSPYTPSERRSYSTPSTAIHLAAA